MINPAELWLAWLDSRATIAALTAERDAARAERDAALLRAAEAEANYRFHFDMTAANDAWRKAARERVTHGR